MPARKVFNEESDLVMSDRLRKLRHHYNLSLQEMGLLLELPPTTADVRINNYERRYNRVSLSIIYTVAKKFNIPVAYLVEPNEEFANQILELWKQSLPTLGIKESDTAEADA